MQRRFEAGGRADFEEEEAALERISCVIHTDGACKGNPGPAGVGFTISDASGAEILTFAEYIGHATNNAAEYRALIRGLEEASRLGFQRVKAVTDSQLMCRQVRGEYRVKNERLAELHAQAVRLMRSFERAEIVDVKREANADADRLASGIVKRHLSRRGAGSV